MGDDDRLRRQPVIGKRHGALNIHLKPAERLVVANGGHILLSPVRSPFTHVNPALQTCDQAKGGMDGGTMRIIACLTVSLLGAALTCSQLLPATAQSGQAWDACIGTATRPDDRVISCTTVIDARSESGTKLAAAYCNRGHGLTEKREFDP